MGYFSLEVAQRGIDNGVFWNPWIVTAAHQSGVEVALIKAVISAESAWDPGAASPSSYGIMQINAAAHNLPVDKLLTDYEFNLNYGATVLGEQIRKRQGDLVLALAGYNAGTSRSDADLRQRYAANTLGVKNYVDTVLAYVAWFRANDPAFPGGSPTPAPGGAASPDPLAIGSEAGSGEPSPPSRSRKPSPSGGSTPSMPDRES